MTSIVSYLDISTSYTYVNCKLRLLKTCDGGNEDTAPCRILPAETLKPSLEWANFYEHALYI